MEELIIGKNAPSFDAIAHNGEKFSNSSLLGKKFILYFYPKDNTPGCTQEACAFRDSFSLLQKKEVLVFGVSKDTIESHQNFAKKYQLPFYLLSDPNLIMCKNYRVWKEKKQFGRTYMGISRSTFLIGKDGTLLKIWNNVQPKNHLANVLQEL